MGPETDGQHERDLAAAEAASARGDVDGALVLVDRILEQQDSPAAHFLRGTILYLDSQYAEVPAEWEAAFRGWRDAGALQAAARVAIDLASFSVSAQGHESAGRGWVERARVLLERVGPCVEWGYLELAALACDRTDVAALFANTERALALAIEHGDSDLEAMAMADGGLALVTQGLLTRGFARLDAAMATIAAGEVGPIAAGLCYCSLLSACDRSGDLRRTEEWTTALRSGERPLPRVLGTHCRVAYGSVLSAAGRWPEAEAEILHALGPSDRPDLAHRALSLSHLATLRLEQGRVEEAEQLLAPYEDRVTSCGPLAEVHRRRGRTDLAIAVLRRGLDELVGDQLRRGPLLAALVQALIETGDLDGATDAAGELAEMAAAVESPSVRAEAATTDARLLVARGEAASAIEAYRRAIGHLAGDERPYALGHIRLELAEVRAGAGETAAAVAEARAALACFERLGATAARDRAAALLRSLGDTSRTRPQHQADLVTALTPREREVLDLVRHGCTNPEIAERLYISPKTAEHHVGRILTKLGVRSRAEAAALALRLEVSGDGP